jgi:hypothetical protein
MRPYDPIAHALSINRRSFLTKSAYGLGSAAFAMLAAKSGVGDLSAAPFSKGALKVAHLPVKAKRVIFLCMAGGPPHLELFDNKPVLKKLDGQAFPESFTKGQQIAQLQGAVLKARGGSFEFKKWGKSGMELTDIFPHIGSVADALCVVRSMKTEQINHDTAHAFFNTGSIIKGRPSMGSWLLYGLGSETENLPGYIVLTSAGRTGLQPISSRQWSSGVLPSKYQGIQFQSKGEAVHYIGNPEGVCQSTQRQVIDEIRRLNGQLAQETVDPEIATRISQYEMAYRMQSSVPELTDLSNEPKHILDMYGPDVLTQGSYAYNCLMARRLAERGVRFVQLMHAGWDQHKNLNTQLKIQCRDVDAPSAALVKDLKQRGLLEDTLVIWGGEFGRTPFLQGDISNTKQWGRDHHPYAFTIWMAGGGVKPGMTFGESDEFGFNAVNNPVHVHDLQATIMHLMGIDHEQFTFRFQGRQFRLTDVHGHVIKPILA